MRALSPAVRHRQSVLAAMGAHVYAQTGVRDLTATAGNDNAGPAAREAMTMMAQLVDHKRSLKAIQSRESKIALKRELLPLYSPWVEGVLAANTGAPDEVLITIMIWRIDVGAYIEAMPLVDYALRHRLPMPAHFRSTLATFVTDEVAKAALKHFELADPAAPPFPAGALSLLEDLVEDEDMHDEVRAKLQKAIGKAILAGADDDDSRLRQEEALRRYTRALELNDGVGVKKDIEQLTRQLKKTAQPPISPDRIEQHAAEVGARAAALGTALAAASRDAPAPAGDV